MKNNAICWSTATLQIYSLELFPALTFLSMDLIGKNENTITCLNSMCTKSYSITHLNNFGGNRTDSNESFKLCFCIFLKQNKDLQKLALCFAAAQILAREPPAALSSWHLPLQQTSQSKDSVQDHSTLFTGFLTSFKCKQKVNKQLKMCKQII